MNYINSPIDARAEIFVQLGITPIKMVQFKLDQYVSPNDSVQWHDSAIRYMTDYANKLYDNITDHAHGICALSDEARKWLDVNLEAFRS